MRDLRWARSHRLSLRPCEWGRLWWRACGGARSGRRHEGVTKSRDGLAEVVLGSEHTGRMMERWRRRGVMGVGRNGANGPSYEGRGGRSGGKAGSRG